MSILTTLSVQICISRGFIFANLVFYEFSRSRPDTVVKWTLNE